MYLLLQIYLLLFLFIIIIIIIITNLFIVLFIITYLFNIICAEGFQHILLLDRKRNWNFTFTSLSIYEVLFFSVWTSSSFG